MTLSDAACVAAVPERVLMHAWSARLGRWARRAGGAVRCLARAALQDGAAESCGPRASALDAQQEKKQASRQAASMDRQASKRWTTKRGQRQFRCLLAACSHRHCMCWHGLTRKEGIPLYCALTVKRRACKGSPGLGMESGNLKPRSCTSKVRHTQRPHRHAWRLLFSLHPRSSLLLFVAALRLIESI